MRCSRCGTTPEDLWRWCPECGWQLSAEGVGLAGIVEFFCVDWATPLPDGCEPESAQGQLQPSGHRDFRG
jgi:hypothetical protein